MKVSKEKLQQIIKEEVEKAQQDEEVVNSINKMRDKFKKLYQVFSKIKGADKQELILLDKLIDAAISQIQQGNGRQALTYALEKLGVKVNE
tara:strand:+ start:884 stop:1156 length:273 start_codon:yes stop_codon:yes gene_type:complete